jgi:hypothetical protein
MSYQTSVEIALASTFGQKLSALAASPAELFFRLVGTVTWTKFTHRAISVAASTVSRHGCL